MVRDRMSKVGLMERLGPRGLYPTEPAAVAALTALREDEGEGDDEDEDFDNDDDDDDEDDLDPNLMDEDDEI